MKFCDKCLSEGKYVKATNRFKGENKWLTIIQNASRHPTVNTQSNHPAS